MADTTSSVFFVEQIAYQASLGFAQACDEADPLAPFQQQFHFPEVAGKPVIYFCGNSLGLQPKAAEAALQQELDTWRQMAVGGYFGGPNPWLHYHQTCVPALCPLLGALPQELVVMNALTVNLHFMMLSFYKPQGKRFKIMMEAGAFPSDMYAIETQVRHHGLAPELAIVEITPRPGQKLLHMDDILQAIENEGDALALCMFSGMNYYTGQLYDMAAITRAAHAVGAMAGFDLAHVVGNVPVHLHQWNADFAVWCSYKYLNGGPGAVGGAFVHQRHAQNVELPRLGGWWGNAEETRFKMEKGFVPKPDASGWCQSTTQVFNTVCLKAALTMIDSAGIDNMRKKSMALTGYLEFLLQQLPQLDFEIITPADANARGAQLSLYFRTQGRAIHQKMTENGIVVDYREPGVIRVAPAPLYCSFQDVYRFYEILKSF
ncbi:MAG: kynureninase [Bacteroidetes bacterium]|nr:MAG: kynureninase [Bacteroidota bacterium]